MNKRIEALAIEWYGKQEKVVDHLPYTDEFELIYSKVITLKPEMTRHELWELMIYLRKAGRLELKTKKAKEESKHKSEGFGF